MQSELTKSAVLPDPSSNADVKARAERLRVAVKAAGGNRAVAARSQVALSTMGEYLAGRDMKAAAMIALARACGVRLDWLATGEGPMREGAPPPPPAPRTLFQTVNQTQLGNAMKLAEMAIQARRISPEPRQQAQIVCIIYDMLSEIDKNPAEQLKQVLAAIEEKLQT